MRCDTTPCSRNRCKTGTGTSSPIVRNPILQDPCVFIKNPEERGHIYLDAEAFAAYLTEDFREPFQEHRFAPSLLRNRMLNELFQETVPRDPARGRPERHVLFHREPLPLPGSRALRVLLPRALPAPDPGRGATKAVLRGDAMRGIVPDQILDCRRKVGFNAPIHALLDTRSALVREQLLDESPVFGLVRRQAIERLLDKAELPNSQSKFLFYFLCAKLFLEGAS